MRMRRKPWARPELANCSYYIKDADKHIGHWSELFGSTKPIRLDLGCGKGVFLASIAPKESDFNFIGIDIKCDIIAVAKRNIEAAYLSAGREIDNLLLCELNIDNIDSAFSPEDKIERIYINFCNPWPKERHKKRRLTHPKKLEIYKSFLSPDGLLFFKTDDSELYIDSLEYLDESGYEIVYKTEKITNENEKYSLPITEHELLFTEKGIDIKLIIAKVKQKNA